MESLLVYGYKFLLFDCRLAFATFCCWVGDCGSGKGIDCTLSYACIFVCLFKLVKSKMLQASQGGYTVDYVTQGAQGGFPGSFLNQNSQAGYSRFGTGNDFMSQVCSSGSEKCFYLEC